ncbi:MAG: TraB/VirB10 family protein [Alphaproteobacteria bacterium]|nr:TraB/VirB10 family protein [Alphaproteobacteria bacterium]
MSLHNLLSKFWKKVSHMRETFDLRSFKAALFQRIPLKRIFNPPSTSGIRRLQFFWAGLILLAFLGAFYSALLFFFSKKPSLSIQEEKKSVPTLVETLPRKVDLNEVLHHKVEGEMQKLSEEILELKTFFQEIRSKDDPEEKESSELTLPKDNLVQTDKDTEIPNAYAHELETKISQLERRLENPASPVQRENNLPFPQNSEEERDRRSIQKFSLSLSENKKLKELKTIETTIPAGAFAKTVLLSGLDASASMNASSDPRPMLLRLVDPGTLPRSFQSDLKDCHCTASAFGDLSSERVYARLEKLSCITRNTGEIIETQVAGYIAGSDGKAGIRGVVASKDGQFLARSLVGGVFAGLSNVANPQSRQSQANPFYPGGSQISPPNVGDMFTAGMAGGASTALDRLSQYYIERAEQLQPVIQIAAGQVVDIVFTEGSFIGSQDVREKIEIQRNDNAQSSASSTAADR